MTDKDLKTQTQALLNQGKTEEAVNFIFNAYLEEHPDAKDILAYRDKVRYKLTNEFKNASPEEQEKSKLLLYGFMTIIGHSEGESAFNIMLLLLHLMRKGQHNSIREAIELIKLEKASSNLNIVSSGNGHGHNKPPKP
ncbi:MAG TPA: hypothetical protein VK927_11815 [Adhaeribacter sp.]|nr:hypothetical protein [Adhaeribacter sp.]